MSPALPTASSKVTPSDSHPPTIDRGPPTEMISDSSSASVPSLSTRLLVSPLLTTASRTMGGSGGTDYKGTQQHPGLLRNPPHENYPRLSQQLDFFFFFSSGMMNDVPCFQLLHGGFIILFINYHDCSISKLTDLSASNDVSMIFQGYIEESNSKFRHS